MKTKLLTKNVKVSKKAGRLTRKPSVVDYDGAGDGIRTRDTLLGRQELFR